MGQQFQIFENTALKQGKVNLTWDETDPNRLNVMKKAFDADDDAELDDDVKAYLANSSDDDDDDGGDGREGLPPIGSAQDDNEELGKNISFYVSKSAAVLLRQVQPCYAQTADPGPRLWHSSRALASAGCWAFVLLFLSLSSVSFYLVPRGGATILIFLDKNRMLKCAAWGKTCIKGTDWAK